MNEEERGAHSKKLMKKITSYLNRRVEGPNSQGHVMINLIIDCFTLMSHITRKHFQDPEAGMKVLMKDLENGFKLRDQEIKKRIKGETTWN